MRKRYNSIPILGLIICVIFMLSPKSSAQEGDSGLAPDELMEKVLADEELPEGIKKKLVDMLNDDDTKDSEEEQIESTPVEDVEYEYSDIIPGYEEMQDEAGEFTSTEEENQPIVEPYTVLEKEGLWREDDVGESAESASERQSTAWGEETEERGGLSSTNPNEPEMGNPGSGQTKANPSKLNKISLDLKGVDIIDVLKMISTRSGLNIVAGRNVRGRVTLFLKDVDVWDAFEIILAANDLAYEKEGEIINVMTERDYEQLYGERYYNKKDLRIFRLEYAKAVDVSKALNQAKSKIGKVITDESSNTVAVIDSPKVLSAMEKMIAEMDMPIERTVFGLEYAKAEDVKTKISEILTKGVGSIQVDERTNKVVVTDLAKKMPEILKVITEMDEKHKEVLIEAKIVQVELDDEYQYGIDWKAVFKKYSSRDGVRFNFDQLGDVFGGTATGGSFTIAQFAHGYLNAAVEILQTVGKANVISSPRITVLNNEEAKVLVGTNQPYVTTTTTYPEGGQQVTSEAVTYIDVGIQLTVTPTINRDGYVTMKIKPKVSSLGTPYETDAGYQYPVVSTSETETTVMVKDGNTILIAGLIQDRDEVEENKIPILGDIPILGNLFRKKVVGSTTQPEKKELVVFLTPYIVQGTEIFPEAENVWYGKKITQRELLEQQMSLAVEDIKMKRSLSEKKTLPPVQAEEAAKKEVIIPPGIIPPSVSRYYSYYEKVRNRIYWFAKDYYPKDLGGAAEDVQVLFTLSSDGNLKGEPRVLNGVDEELAKATKLAVEKAAPFPPFPEKMEKDQESFRVVVSYQ